MKWGALLTEVREQLGDINATPKWTDALLYIFLRDAIQDVSMYLPLRCDNVALVADPANPKKFALPADFLEEKIVECPEGNALNERQDRPGVRRIPSSRPLFYEVDGSSLYLDANPGGSAVLLSYYGVHGLPATAGSIEFELTVPDRDIELVKLYMLAQVNSRERNRQSMQDRYKLGTSDRQDNPVQPEVQDFFRRYHEKLAERSGRVVFLQRLRRYK